MRLLKFIDHFWRLVATTLSFIVFGVGGLIMGVLVFPLLFVFVRDSERRKFTARRLVGKAFGGFWEMMRVMRILDYKIEGAEHIDDTRNQLIVANHPTLIDVVILTSLFPRANCVIKGAVTRNLFMRSVVRAADYISNSQPEELLGSCVAYLQSGGSLMLFPEGTRSRAGEGLVFKPGAATVAARTGVAVLPVVIRCNPLFLTKELPWYFVPATRPRFTIRVLPPCSTSELADGGLSERVRRQQLNESLRERIGSELKRMEFSA